MLLEMVEQDETDLIEALERKLEKNHLIAGFEEDPRVSKVIVQLYNKRYHMKPALENIYDQMTFLDNAWTLSYLLKCAGEHDRALNIRNHILRFYNPFDSINPVTQALAYCESIEDSSSTKELEQVIESMDFYLARSKDPILIRAYPTLNKIADNCLSYLEKKEEYELGVMTKIKDLVGNGDDLATDWHFSEAVQHYERAEELARYQLMNPDLADWVKDRLKEVTKEMCYDEKKKELKKTG